MRPLQNAPFCPISVPASPFMAESLVEVKKD